MPNTKMNPHEQERREEIQIPAYDPLQEGLIEDSPSEPQRGVETINPWQEPQHGDVGYGYGRRN